MKYVSITDDNESDLTLAKFLVEQERLPVVSHSDGYSTLEALSEYEFCLFIIDLQMPQIKGIELIKRIRKIEGFKTTPVLVMSSRKEAKDVKVAVEAGATDYIIKPIDHMIFKTKVINLSGGVPDKWTEYPLPSDEGLDVAAVMEKCSARSINELGLTIQSPFTLEVGQSREIAAEVLTRLGINKVTTIVKACDKLDQFYEIRLEFVGMTEADRKRIRIYCRELSTKRFAA